jgi:hypothetical protein
MNYKLITIATALAGLTVASFGQITPFSGFDLGANAGDPHPNSAAAEGMWDTAVGFYGVNAFENAALGAFANLNNDPDMTVSGSGTTSILNAPIDSPSSVYGYNTTVSGSKYVSVYGGNATFTFNTTMYAFGAYVSGNQISNINFSWNDGSPQSQVIPSDFAHGGVAYVGFIDAAGFTSVTLNGYNDILGVDDVHYSSVNPTPEPISMTLLGAGVLALLRRRSAK